MTSEFCFRSISWERRNGFWPNLAYVLILTTSGLGLLNTFFINSIQSYGPWMMSGFRFRSISWVWRNGIWQNFADALILFTSSLGLLIVYFRQFVTELLLLNDVRISFPLNILITNKWILTKFYMCIDIDNILLGIVKHTFLSIHYSVMALELCQHVVSAQYLETEWMDFDQILPMGRYW